MSMGLFVTRWFKAGAKMPPHIEKQLRSLDKNVFIGCEEPTWERTNWIILMKGRKLAAYAGVMQLEGSFYMNRAAVAREFRGFGLQKKLIKQRVEFCRSIGKEPIITYTVIDNPESSNSLISCGFKLYTPEYAWAGDKVLYWRYV